MRKLLAILAGLSLLMAASAWALTADEVIKLKKAGVSDATIQKMLDSEAAGGGQDQGVVRETNDAVVYQAGQGNAARREQNQRHEAWKEQKAMDAVGGVVIDTRTVTPK